MTIYKCFYCRREIKEEIVKRRVRCPYCSSKILYKPRTINTKVKAE